MENAFLNKLVKEPILVSVFSEENVVKFEIENPEEVHRCRIGNFIRLCMEMKK